METPMPFDATPFTHTDQVADPTALYRERREKAAALWERVPVERFDLTGLACDSTACALGHLGLARHDGWNIPEGFLVPEWGGVVGAGAAVAYFGLTQEHAQAVFGMPGVFELYGKHQWDITPTDVSHALLALPYTLPSAA
jgi:hypothetical protein